MVIASSDSVSVGLAAAALAVVFVSMLVELRVSQRNERAFRRQGAVDAPDPVYAVMRWAYPGAFVAMAVEGALSGASFGWQTPAGILVFVVGKALKVWAIRSLGTRWTYRVLVHPGAPLVTTGPYAFLRHPNYVGVVGELVGMGLMMHATVSGPVMTLFFMELLRRRIAAEERALGLPRPSDGTAPALRR
jgi:methyltransferase